MNNGPNIRGGVGCGIMLIPVVFIGGGVALGKLAQLLTWLFG